jgi:hypothetical protein
LLNESFRNVVRSESGPKLIPGHIMTSWLHGMILIPPYAGSATKLLSYEQCLVRV